MITVLSVDAVVSAQVCPLLQTAGHTSGEGLGDTAGGIRDTAKTLVSVQSGLHTRPLL